MTNLSKVDEAGPNPEKVDPANETGPVVLKQQPVEVPSDEPPAAPAVDPEDKPEDPPTETDAEEAVKEEKTPGFLRHLVGRLTRFTLLIVVPLLILLGVGYWMVTSGQFVSTENAYVKSSIIAISPSLDGRVTEVFVSDNQRVEAGDVLFRLNSRPYEIAFDQSLARMAAVSQEIEQRRAEYFQVRAEMDETSERVSFFTREFERQQELSARGVATKTKLEEAEFNLAAARRAFRTASQKSQAVLASLGGSANAEIEDHPLYQEALAERERALLNLGFTEIRAPASGIVSQMRLQPGEWIESGDPIFGLIEVDNLWIEANLKETQLTHVVEGQAVSISVDAYPNVTWPGRIGSISPATGAEFSVLPPQNASGNWVKVVQRLPLRIEVKGREDRPQLRAGMTATIEIDTERDRSLPVVWGEFSAWVEKTRARIEPQIQGVFDLM